MKKIFIAICLSIFFLGSFAQTLSKPVLITPVNGETRAMPTQTILWRALASLTPVTYTITIADNANFDNAKIYQSSVPDLVLSNLKYGQTYYWKVFASTATESSEESDAFNFTVIPSITLKNTSVTSSINVEIGVMAVYGNSVLSGFDGFEYMFGTDPTFEDPDVTYHEVMPKAESTIKYNSEGKIESYTLASFNKLKYNTKYHYQIRIYTNVGSEKMWSEFASRTITTPKAPELKDPEDGVVYDMKSDFKWKPIKGTDEYVLEISENADFTGEKLSLVTTSVSVLPNGIGFGKKYYWRVKAMSTTSESSYSEVRSFSTSAQNPNVIAPANNVNQDNNPVYFVCNKIAGAEGYVLEFYDPNDNSSPKKVIERTVFKDPRDSISNLSKTISITKYLEFDKPIEWTFKGFARNDTTSKSEPRVVSVKFSSPTLVFPANNISVNNLITIKWATLLGATGYEIQYASDVNFTKDLDVIKIKDPLQIEVQVLFPAGRDFFIRMRAVAGSKYSEYCQTRKFHTDISQPQLIAPLHKYEGNPTLVNSPVSFSWSPVYGVEEYVVQYSRDINFENESEITVINSELISPLGYTEPIEIPLGTYYWRVKGLNTWPTTDGNGKPILDVDGNQEFKTYESIFSNIGNFRVVEELGVNDKVEASFSIYPNPCNDKITVENLRVDVNGTICVADVTGKRVIAMSLREASEDGKVEINVSPLDAGVYFIMIEGDNQILSRKFVKK